jgi:CBS domain-containing protein
MKTCRDLMTRELFTLPVTASVLDVARLMQEHRIGFVPICEPGSGALLGVVTDRALVTEICASDRRPSQVTLDEIMVLQPPYCLEDSHLQSAEETMLRHQASRLVVVNIRRHPVGVLGMSAVLRALRRFGGSRGGASRPQARP